MSKTTKSKLRTKPGTGHGYNWNDPSRPEHQQERGPRYGNNRKMWAKLKVKDRRVERHSNKMEVIRLFTKETE